MAVMAGLRCCRALLLAVFASLILASYEGSRAAAADVGLSGKGNEELPNQAASPDALRVAVAGTDPEDAVGRPRPDDGTREEAKGGADVLLLRHAGRADAAVEEHYAPSRYSFRKAVRTKDFWIQRATELIVMVMTTYAVLWAYGKMGCPFKRFPLKYLVPYIVPKNPPEREMHSEAPQYQAAPPQQYEPGHERQFRGDGGQQYPMYYDEEDDRPGSREPWPTEGGHEFD